MSENKSTPKTTKTQKTSEPSKPQTADPWAYTDIVKDHFLNPRNFIMGDETKWHADGEGIVGNPVCGDQMLIKIRVKNEKIADIGWKTYGCASAIASTSALSELAKGRTLDDADKITAKEICDFLGGLPEHKFHCSVLGHQALHKAILDYKTRAGR
ncbi:iron-sulfur cluster assembly scaffold protein [Candidatus Saccharibacteria bacterium]|nr:iron-sulfur cluster assembly scaffold protein [Candidatus Saccharibacteria bacterium]